MLKEMMREGERVNKISESTTLFVPRYMQTHMFA